MKKYFKISLAIFALLFLVLSCDDKPYEVKRDYTVTFNSNGGSEIAPIELKDGDKVPIPEEPVLDGKTFVYWALDGKAYDFESEVTKDITLVALFVDGEKGAYIEATKTSFDTLAEAIESVKEGEEAVIRVLGKDEKIGRLSGSGIKGDITLIGKGKDKTAVDLRTEDFGDGGYPFYVNGKSITFKSLSVILGGTLEFQGVIRAESLLFEDCSILGMGTYWGVGDVSFKNCIFEQPNPELNVKPLENPEDVKWAYNIKLWSGTSFTFDNCNFINDRGRFILAYRESGGEVKVSVNNCTFITEDVNPDMQKPAICIDPNQNGDIKWIVDITGGNYENLAKGETTGSSVYNVKAPERNDATVIIDGVVVWENGAKVE